MITKRSFLGVFALVAVAALLVWKFWPTGKSAPTSAVTTATAAAAKATASSVLVSKPAVEAPKLPPAQASSTSDGPSLANNGSSLYDASKARAAATNLSGAGDDDYNAIVKGSPDLAKLDSKLAQNAALTHGFTPIDPDTIPTVITTDLGDIALVPGQPIKRVLASGDEVVLTLSHLPQSFGDFDWSVSVMIMRPDADGRGAEINSNSTVYLGGSVMTTSTFVQLGQPIVIKATPADGNEIHFVPEAATPAGTSH